MTDSEQLARTPLYDHHIQAGAKMVDFAGWLMPTDFGSQIEEHHAVRQNVGLFDVSHMCITDISGEQAKAFLRRLLANDVDKLHTDGQAIYGCMLNDKGGILDDLITYRLTETGYRLVTNAATSNKIRSWINEQSRGFELSIQPRVDLAMIAVQGPKAIEHFTEATAIDSDKLQALPAFHSLFTEGHHISRTGYTGEDGLEIILDSNEAGPLWQTLTGKGCRPVGLGARDTLRLEAGLHLYGHDMDESVTPFECGLKWTVALKDEEREFIGRQALLSHKGHERYKMLGVLLTERGVLRDGQTLYTEQDEQGIITSGSFSPTLQCGIGLARVNRQAGPPFTAQIRKKQQPVKAVKPPFVRHGKASYKELSNG